MIYLTMATREELRKIEREKLLEWSRAFHSVQDREARRSVFMKLLYTEDYRILSIKLTLAGIMFLFIGGAFALFLRGQAGLTSTGAPVVLDPAYYFQAMTNHVMDMIFGAAFNVVFAIAFYMIPALNGTRLVKWPKLANTGFWLNILALFMMNLGGIKNQYMFTFLNPLQASPTWYIGYGLMIVAEWMEMASVLGTSFFGKNTG
ncbi:cbb3-type cytochrome c oxidase subunit I [Metallosphaera hakonensis]|uniref:cbb3-type cytochrome c oxidase subunit I n=1 Tax=Metallosphaera hakonensis TaxID=79601 RepID=UPI000A7A29BD|nr:cbb3-type cytochrome c oxidase subunit I [Metallosphaera hakonensis]